MRTRTTPEAAGDQRDIYRWLRRNRPGWAPQFKREYTAARLSLQRLPYQGQEIRDGVRRRILGNVPYAILYRIEGNRVLIIAVTNLSREPGWWEGRD